VVAHSIAVRGMRGSFLTSGLELNHRRFNGKPGGQRHLWPGQPQRGRIRLMASRSALGTYAVAARGVSARVRSRFHGKARLSSAAALDTSRFRVSREAEAPAFGRTSPDG
jgi:hypothetical protein